MDSPARAEYRWSAWSEFTPCSRSCGLGIKSRLRNCYKSGKTAIQVSTTHCHGDSREYSLCNAQPCPSGSRHFRNLQCSFFNGQKYQGKVYNWTWYDPGLNQTETFNNIVPCSLLCTPLNSFGTAVVKFSSHVVDGTSCGGDDSGVCIAGKCVSVGCDKKLGSTKSVDKCNVCGGNDTGCDDVSGRIRRRVNKGYTELLGLPKGSRNIMVTEKPRSKVILAMKDKDGIFFLSGTKEPVIQREVAGTIFKYRQNNQSGNVIEILEADGPINETVIIMGFSRVERTAVAIWYSYTTPSVEPSGITENHNLSAEPFYPWKTLLYNNVIEGKLGLSTKRPPPERTPITNPIRVIRKKLRPKRIMTVSKTESFTSVIRKVGQPEVNQLAEGTDARNKSVTPTGVGKQNAQTKATSGRRASNKKEYSVDKTKKSTKADKSQRRKQNKKSESFIRTEGTDARNKSVTSTGVGKQNAQTKATSGRRPSNKKEYSVDKTKKFTKADKSQRKKQNNKKKQSSNKNTASRKRQTSTKQKRKQRKLLTITTSTIAPFSSTSHPPTPDSTETPTSDTVGVTDTPELITKRPNIKRRQQGRLKSEQRKQQRKVKKDDQQGELSINVATTKNEPENVDQKYNFRRQRGHQIEQIKFEWRENKITPCSTTCEPGISVSFFSCYRISTNQPVDDAYCDKDEKPELSHHVCSRNACPPRWVAGEWGQCSRTCGAGLQERQVKCWQLLAPGFDSSVHDYLCPNDTKPGLTRKCNAMLQCGPLWEMSEWEKCSADCGYGWQERSVRCSDGNDATCGGNRPIEKRACMEKPCSNHWYAATWSECSGVCGVTHRKVFCRDKRGLVLEDGHCDLNTKPLTVHACGICEHAWVPQEWRRCSVTCGDGYSKRNVVCGSVQDGEFYVQSDNYCQNNPRPITTTRCSAAPCGPKWYTTEWGECSKPCGTGAIKMREVRCYHGTQISHDCFIETQPDNVEPCTLPTCPSNISHPGGKCIDDGTTNCNLIFKTNVCTYDFYREACCHTCRMYGLSGSTSTP
ncbi:ADAMTS-like protein 2 [Patella vulgata]|uniref:ADAMTS-like protein 2 n=1 Tax=Patella vulgata TaxID=6465 RepID=UPI00217F23E4|nr:ADAMTS-like protein 2 [Patella vulgata]